MRPFLIPIAFLLLAASVLPACGGQPASPGKVTDYESLVGSLRAAGATLVFAEAEIQQPFFSVSGRVIGVNGENVQVFEYPNEAETALVSEDGSTVGMTMITWVAAPHFYRAGKLIVIYVGEDESVLGSWREFSAPVCGKINLPLCTTHH